MLSSYFTYFIQFTSGDTRKRFSRQGEWSYKQHFTPIFWVKLLLVLIVYQQNTMWQDLDGSSQLQKWQKARFSAQCFLLTEQWVESTPFFFLIIRVLYNCSPHYLKQLESRASNDTVSFHFVGMKVIFKITNVLSFMDFQWTSITAHNKNESISYWHGLLMTCFNSKLYKMAELHK